MLEAVVASGEFNIAIEWWTCHQRLGGDAAFVRMLTTPLAFPKRPILLQAFIAVREISVAIKRQCGDGQVPERDKQDADFAKSDHAE